MGIGLEENEWVQCDQSGGGGDCVNSLPCVNSGDKEVSISKGILGVECGCRGFREKEEAG